MDRRTYLAAASGVMATLAGCLGGLGSGGGGTCEGDCDVGMSANAFLPREISVSVGETVVWKNTSSKGHTVTAYDDSLPEGADFFASGDFESTEAARDGWAGGLEGRLAPGDTFEHTFEVPGTHGYFCIPHERANMDGLVHVEAD